MLTEQSFLCIHQRSLELEKSLSEKQRLWLVCAHVQTYLSLCCSPPCKVPSLLVPKIYFSSNVKSLLFVKWTRNRKPEIVVLREMGEIFTQLPEIHTRLIKYDTYLDIVFTLCYIIVSNQFA